jgi:hypothetical protein
LLHICRQSRYNTCCPLITLVGGSS